MHGNSTFSFAQYKCLGPWISTTSIDNNMPFNVIQCDPNSSMLEPCLLQHKYLLQVLLYNESIPLIKSVTQNLALIRFQNNQFPYPSIGVPKLVCHMGLIPILKTKNTI